jgi:hypothetical protein
MTYWRDFLATHWIGSIQSTSSCSSPSITINFGHAELAFWHVIVIEGLANFSSIMPDGVGALVEEIHPDDRHLNYRASEHVRLQSCQKNSPFFTCILLLHLFSYQL